MIEIEVGYDEALNSAGWDMIIALKEYGPLTGHQFNNMKSCLKKAIETYLAIKFNGKPKEVSNESK